MSSGSVKKKKREGKEVLYQTTITVLRNGNVNVSGFPANVMDATKLVGDFNAAMWNYFVQEASKGNVDHRGVVKNTIVAPNKYRGLSKIVGPGQVVP